MRHLAQWHAVKEATKIKQSMSWSTAIYIRSIFFFNHHFQWINLVGETEADWYSVACFEPDHTPPPPSSVVWMPSVFCHLFSFSTWAAGQFDSHAFGAWEGNLSTRAKPVPTMRDCTNATKEAKWNLCPTCCDTAALTAEPQWLGGSVPPQSGCVLPWRMEDSRTPSPRSEPSHLTHLLDLDNKVTVTLTVWM